jgi:hypothetical protein
MMIDGCLAWEERIPLGKFHYIGARETHVGRQGSLHKGHVWSGSTLGGVHLVLF